MPTQEAIAQRERSTDYNSKYDHGFESHSVITPWNQRDHAWDHAEYDATHPKEYTAETEKQTQGAYNAFAQQR
jgi:hypothetical protein